MAIWGATKKPELRNVHPKTELPKRLPVGTKYVVESCGEFVRRFVELPNGDIIDLPTRKAHTCSSAEQVSIVPEQAPRRRSKIDA